MSRYFAAGGVDSDLFLQLPDLLSGSLRWSASARPKELVGAAVYQGHAAASFVTGTTLVAAFWPAASINNCAQREE